MANGNNTPVHPGQDQLAGSATALFLKKFSGEVLTTFERLNVMRRFVQIRSISGGKSAAFPVVGRATSGWHVPGTNIEDGGNNLLSSIATSERVITIDNKLISAISINDWEEAQAAYEVRSIYTTELARALALKFDKAALQTAILAARASATLTLGSDPGPYSGGSAITDANMKTQGAAISAALFLAAQKMDEKDVPKEGRVAIVSPQMYYALIKDPSVFLQTTGVFASPQTGILGTVTTGATSSAAGSVATGQDIAALQNPNLQFGNANWAQGTIASVAGIMVVPSNNIPSTNILNTDPFWGTVGVTGANNQYWGDFSKTAGVVLHPSAIGCVQLRGLAVEQEYRIHFQATLAVAKFALGMGILRPECAIELATP
jgi:hypothetical protein